MSRFPEEVCFSPETGLFRVVTPHDKMQVFKSLLFHRNETHGSVAGVLMKITDFVSFRHGVLMKITDFVSFRQLLYYCRALTNSIKGRVFVTPRIDFQ